MRRLLALVLPALLVVAACGDDDDDDAASTTPEPESVTIQLVTHDSFVVSDDVLAAFTEDTGIEVELVPLGDAGAALNQVILNKDDPLGDVLFGVDNTFLSRALDEELFVAYESPRLDAVDDRYELDDEHRVTPIDHGEVCVNYDRAFFEGGITPPEDLADLAAPELRGELVVENPATSSPGLAFLLATIAEFGEDGWQDYWRSLRENDVQVATGWEEAYNQSFSAGAGKGEQALVVSYASSPPAEVVFADPPREDAPTGVATGTCFEQIEFAGILDGTEHVEEAQALVDFLLSDAFQEDMPLQMFVFPVVDSAELPEVFVEHAAVIEAPLQLDPAEVGENRDRWIEEWTSIVLQ